ncbi:unnamed protein product [Blepharisma stoltei]|uniref:Uncharacterized protein n=1 Tax=Blepharisma stoltei TaxID=1481888 RepID=A0AAU9I6U2_9CILI|nr:unnamed protein product [Blepharisma stoltei]
MRKSYLWVLLYFGAWSLTTSEITTELEKLKNIKQVVEVVIFNLDSYKISWEYEKPEDNSEKIGQLALEYHFVNETNFNEQYWEFWKKFSRNEIPIEEFANKFPWVTTNYNVFLLLNSSNYLEPHNYFDYSDQICQVTFFNYSIFGDSIIIQAHPLMKIHPSSIHYLFSTKLFPNLPVQKNVQDYTLTIDKIAANLQQINTIEEDISAIFYEEYKDFKDVWQHIYEKLSAYKASIEKKRLNRIPKIMSYLEKYSGLSRVANKVKIEEQESYFWQLACLFIVLLADISAVFGIMGYFKHKESSSNI